MQSIISCLSVHQGLIRAATFRRSDQPLIRDSSGNGVIQGGKKTWHAICNIPFEALNVGAGCRQTGNSY
jgi:hypothetical protein